MSGSALGAGLHRRVPEVFMAKSQSAAWGIDVGTTAIKAIKLRRDGDKVFLEAMEVIEHSHFLSEPDIDRREIIRESLGHFLERYSLHGERVYIGAPGVTSFSRFVKLPPVEPRKIPEIVRFEAIQQIPFPLDQVIWDYHSFRNPDSPDVEIGIFAIKTDLVGAILADFQALGITVHGLQLAPLAVYNTVVFEGKGLDKGTIFLDIGADHTDIIVVDQGRLWLRNINLGGNSFTESLAKSFRFAFTKAEALKKNAATSKYARQIFQAMRPTFADIVAEIQRSFGYYNSSHRESRVEQIIGMGNPFRLSNLQKYLQQYLGMEVARLDGFAKIEFDDAKMAAGLSDQALGMTVAYGLALQGIDLAAINTNLLPVEIARQMIWRQKYPWFAATAALFVIGAAASAARYSMDASALQASIHAAGLRTAKVKILRESTLRNKYNSISNTYQSNVAKINYYLALGKKREIWPEIVQTLFQSLPQASTKKPADVKNPDTWKIVLQSVTSTYEPVLSNQITTGNNQQVMPVMATRTPAAGAGVTSATAAPSGGGFQLVISGYTPYRSWGRILQEFQDRIEKFGGAAAHKPFVMTIVKGSLATARIGNLMGGGGGGANSGGLGFVPWGSVLGPFSGVFLPQFLPKSAVEKSSPNVNQNVMPQNNMPTFPGGMPGMPGMPGMLGMPMGGPGGFRPPGMPQYGGASGIGMNFSTQSSGAIHGAIDPNTKASLNDATAFEMIVNVYVQ
ncbi:MAG: type IV pilus assembly protein PilM [Phycisphaerae bacterium]